MNSTLDDLQKLKVVQLRAELTARGLDTKGVKAILVDRLLAAMNGGESGVAVSVSVGNGSELPNSSSEIDEDGSEDLTTTNSEQASPKRATRSGATESDGVNNKPTAGSPVKTLPAPIVVANPLKVASPVTSPSAQVKEKLASTVATTLVASPAVAAATLSPTKTSPVVSPVKTNPVSSPPVKASPVASPPVKASPVSSPVKASPAASPVKASPVATPEKPVEPAATPTVDTPTKDPENEPKDIPTQSDPSHNSSEQLDTESEKVVNEDVEMPEENAEAEESETPMETEENQDNEGDVENGKRKIEAVNGDSESADNPEAKKVKTEEPVIKIIPENEPEFSNDEVLLDWYKSDLNLKISTENFLDAEPIVHDDFPFAYAGAKGTYGFTAGELCFEAKWTGTCEVKQEFGDSEAKHVFRVGWSDLHTNLQLGEESFSYGFDSSGKFYNGGEVQDLGEPLVEGDVITAYLNLDSDPIEIKFSKNGTTLGEEAIQIPKSDVEEKVWFPHVLVRNVKFQVNFGNSEPAFPALDGYDFVGKVEPNESRVRGPVRAEKKEECDFVMLVGMAGCGKTKWTKDYIKSNLDKHYNILGTSTVVERAVKKTTTISGPNLPKVFEAFLSKAGKFAEKLVDLAPSRRRNYILDQSNVVPNVQRRKCGGFEGFRRRAVVILPPDEEYQKRIKSKEQEQGKSVPKSTILEMKATLRLPEEGELFSSVEFPELSKEEAQELVTKYNKEGVSAGYGRPPSSRGGQRGGYRGRGGSQRGGRGFQRGPGGGWPRRGGPGGMRGFGGGMRRGGPPGPPIRIPRGPPVQGAGGPPRGRGMPMRVMRGGGGPPRGMPQPRGGAWVRGGGGRGGGDRGSGQGFTRAPFPARGGGGRGGRGGGGPAQGAPTGNRWRGGPSGPQGFNNPGNNRSAQGGFPNWGGQQNWGGRSSGGNNMNSGFGGGFGGQQFADPWVQQVPDQGYGQAWDSVGNNSNNGGGRGGGTWQGYGGQTFGSYNSGNFGGRK